MFSKTKEPETALAPQAATKRAQRSGIPSIISSDLTIKGTLISTGELQIDGRIEGDVRATSLVIGEKATIQGDIYAEDATIRGNIMGGIRARKVQLCATCHVEGTIIHEALSVEAGAFFEGNCRHSDNPLGDAPEMQASARRAAPAPKPAAKSNGDSPPVSSTPIQNDEARPQAARAAANFTPLKA